MWRHTMELCRMARTVPIVSDVAKKQARQVLQTNLQRNIFKTHVQLAHNKDPILRAMMYQRPFQQIEESSLMFQAMNRNNRKPKRANKGARPCSRVSRRAKKRSPGNWRR